MKHDVHRIRAFFHGTRYKDFERTVTFEPVAFDHPKMARDYVANERRYGYWSAIKHVEDFLVRFRDLPKYHHGKGDPDDWQAWPAPLLLDDRELREWARGRVNDWMERRVRPRDHAIGDWDRTPKAYQFHHYVELLIECRDWRARAIAEEDHRERETRRKYPHLFSDEPTNGS